MLAAMSRWRYLLLTLGLALLALLTIALMQPAPAQAGGVVGNGFPENCTEAALVAALAGGGPVTFACGSSPVTITLTSAQTISLNTTIDGAHRVTISGGNSTRLFAVESGTTFTLRNLTLRDAHNPCTEGGAILSAGNLIIANSQFINNRAAGGGAIHAHGTGTTTISDSDFTGNSALTTGGQGCPEASGEGGAISSRARLIVRRATFSGNEAHNGAAIRNWAEGSLSLAESDVFGNTVRNRGGGVESSGPLSIARSTFTDNHAGNAGGGLAASGVDSTLREVDFFANSAGGTGGAIIHGGGLLTITTSTLLSNTATIGGAVGNTLAPLTIIASTLANNTASQDGGAINNADVLTVISSTLSSNSAWNGGALFALGGKTTISNTAIYRNAAENSGGGIATRGGVQDIVNSTISHNSALNSTATAQGGGIASGGGLHVSSSTIADNVASLGGGLYNSDAGGAVSVLENTIVANNPAGDNCTGTITSQGFNLDSGATCAFGGTGDVSNLDPLLGPLQNNGGPTLTRGLRPDSPAIGQGIPGPNCPATDQRGVARPQGTGCDIGAYEYDGAVPGASLVSPLTDRNVVVDSPSPPGLFPPGVIGQPVATQP